MSHKNMTINELADMLGFDFHGLTRMARRGDIPSQSVRGEFRFNAQEIFFWLQKFLPTMTHSQLMALDHGMSQYRNMPYQPPMVTPLLRTPAITPDLDARTPCSIKRKLVNLAYDTQYVYDKNALLDQLTGSTLPCGAALLHPKQALAYELAEPVMVVAKTRGPVLFNQDTHSTLFFLCAAQDEPHQIHLLARLCRLLQNPDLVDQLNQAQDPSDIVDALTEAENALACSLV